MTATKTDHQYSSGYYSYIEQGSFSSAQTIVALMNSWLRPTSVLDLGCGRGAWLKTWRDVGVTDAVGVDGDYVKPQELHIPHESFFARDLREPVDIGRRFDLATSFEVAEHLAPDTSEAFVQTLVNHADRVMFSAATPGQGGEHHINERPIEFWRDLFAKHGYVAFDFIRPRILGCRSVELWYQFNMLLYVRASEVENLPGFVAKSRLDDDKLTPNVSTLGWELRRALVRPMPRWLVDWIAVNNAKYKAARVNGN